jgi:hypothetical protein
MLEKEKICQKVKKETEKKKQTDIRQRIIQTLFDAFSWNLERLFELLLILIFSLCSFLFW